MTKSFRVGVLTLWMNSALEDDLISLVRNDIGLHFHRFMPAKLPKDANDERYLHDLARNIHSQFKYFSKLGLDHIVIGCTSLATVMAQLPNTAEGVDITFAFDAILNQLKSANCSQIGLVAPYSTSTIAEEKRLFNMEGVVVTDIARLNYENEFKDTTTEEIVSKALCTYRQGGGIVISCTALNTGDAINILKLELPEAKLITSSNHAIAAFINQLDDPIALQQMTQGQQGDK
ncbi:MAG: hypothetical protein AB3N28_01915 [Kordiimonas sp.]